MPTLHDCQTRLSQLLMSTCCLKVPHQLMTNWQHQQDREQLPWWRGRILHPQARGLHPRPRVMASIFLVTIALLCRSSWRCHPRATNHCPQPVFCPQRSQGFVWCPNTNSNHWEDCRFRWRCRGEFCWLEYHKRFHSFNHLIMKEQAACTLCFGERQFVWGTISSTKRGGTMELKVVASKISILTA